MLFMFLFSFFTDQIIVFTVWNEREKVTNIPVNYMYLRHHLLPNKYLHTILLMVIKNFMNLFVRVSENKEWVEDSAIDEGRFFSKRIFSIVFFVMVAEISFKLGMVFLLTLNVNNTGIVRIFFNRLFGKKGDIGIKFCYWRKLYGDVTFTASQHYLGRFFLSLRWTIILRRSFKSDTS